jgi:ABC-2 type transport system permease protein
MNTTAQAVRIGIERGITLFRQIVTTTDGIANTVFWNGIPLAVLLLNRNSSVEGTSLSFATVALPGFLGLMVASAAYGPAYYLAAEREDGTLLRAKAVPNGIIGYTVGVLTQSVLETAISVAILLVPGLLLFEGLVIDGIGAWLTFVGVMLLGLLATLPIGIIIGSVVKSPRLIGGLGLFVLGGMAAISGIFIPIQALPEWLGWIGQSLPTYWVGIGMRSVFLPEAAMALEVGGTWRTLEMVVVLAAWTAVGAAIAPRVLRRMARRTSGSALEASRDAALRRV